MSAYTLPDGTKIDVAVTGHHLGPGHTGQQCARDYYWYKVNDGEWKPTNFRSAHRLREWIEMSQTLEEFMYGEEGANV